MSTLEGLVSSSIAFLKSRHHPEKPHISVLAPPHPIDYSLVWKKPKGFKEYGDKVEEDEEVLEEFEEFLIARAPGWIFGSDFELGEEGEEWHADVRFSFYVRVKPDFDDESKWDESAYTRVSLSLKYCKRGGHRSLKGDLLLKPGDEGKPKSGSIDESIGADFIALAAVPREAVNYLNKEGLKKVLERIASIGLKKAIIGVDVKPIFIDGNYLSAQVYNRDGHKIGIYHHAFCVLVGCYGNLFKAYLINLGGFPESDSRKLVEEVYERPSKVYTFNANDESSRWVLGHLLEVEGFIEFSSREHKVKWDGFGLRGAYPINALVIEEGRGLILRDYWVASERLSPIKRAQLSSGDFLKSLVQEFKGPPPRELETFLQALSEALNDAAKVSNFYTYQEEAIKEILASLGLINGQQRKAIAIVARTAGGKTYAFLVPILIKIFCSKVHSREAGVKAILAYPTKALANDQVEEVATLLFHLKNRLSEAGLSGIEISFGCLHGNTYDANYIREITSTRRHEHPYLPVKCPLHGSSVYVEENNSRFRARCPSTDECTFASFLDAWMRKTREEIYFDPPDILITDEDMINRMISGVSRVHSGRRGAIPWFEWQLFGYPYMRCKECMHTYPPCLNIDRCRVCGADLRQSGERVGSLSKLTIIVLDEAHQIYGSFGIQVHHMLSLLERVLGHKPLYVLSSATLGDAGLFASTLLGLGTDEVEVIGAEVEAGLGKLHYQRIFALVMPKAYTMDATTVRILMRFCEEFKKSFNRTPKGIIFTNTLPENNELLQHLRNAFATGEIKIDGHSTDFEGERVQKELAFKAGGIDLFVATSTLELGVDYGVVDFVTIYGMPAKISSFVQRMGRAGRNRDAVVFVVFDPDSPLNYSYYESCKILCDGSLRDEAMAHEVILVSPMNEEAVRRAVRRWVVSEIHRLCAGREDLCRTLINELVSPRQRRNVYRRIIEHIQNVGDLPESLSRLCEYFNNYCELIREAVDAIARQIENMAADLRGISDLVRTFGEESLYNLRAADDEVLITYRPLNVRDNRRLRELRYVIRHCLHGQVTSYRGLFFSAYPEERDQMHIKQWFGE